MNTLSDNVGFEINLNVLNVGALAVEILWVVNALTIRVLLVINVLVVFVCFE